MFERFANAARDVVTSAVEETRRRGDHRVGTDHLLLGLLRDTDMAQAVGVDADAARAAAQQLDEQALTAIGYTTGDLPTMDTTSTNASMRKRRTAFSSGSRAVMQRTLTLTTAEKSRQIAPRHLLLALLELEPPDPAATLLSALDVDRTAIRQRFTYHR